MGFDVPPFIDLSSLPDESSDIVDFIAPFLTFNSSRNMGKEFIISYEPARRILEYDQRGRLRKKKKLPNVCFC
jgi:hypothetical protein